MASTMSVPTMRRVCWKRDRAMSMRAKSFERPCSEPQEAQDREGKRETGDRKTGREGKIEACESELIDQIGEHVHLAAADQLGSCKGAERPGEGRGYSGNDPGCGERQRHGKKGANGTGS